jgi:gliding motility-associated-like protein
MRHILILLAVRLLTLAPELSAQNLLVNGGHEDFTPSPGIPDPANICFRELYAPGPPPSPFQPLNPPGIASACASPDHHCLIPRTGTAHGGFFHWAGSKFENPQYQLCSPLIPGESYDVEVWLRLTEQSGLGCDQIGFWFTDWGFFETGAQIQATPDYRTPAGQFYVSKDYQSIRFQWEANASQDAMIVGNFVHPGLPDGSQTVKLPEGGGDFAYYFIDDLRIRPIPRLVGPNSLCPGGRAIFTLANRPACSAPPLAQWVVSTSDTMLSFTGNTLLLDLDAEAELWVFLPEDTLYRLLPLRDGPPAPALDAVQILCAGDSLLIDASFNGTATGHEWSSGESSPSLTVTAPGLYGVSFQAGECFYFLETLILEGVAWEPPVWEDTLRICPGDTVILSATLPYPYQLVSEDGQRGDTLRFSRLGRHLIRVEPAPCGPLWANTLDLLPPLSPDAVGLRIPNLFTPNGDGTNDLFSVGEKSGLSAYSLRVYNRWGKEVFRSTDPAQGWDGTWNGKEQPSDTYAYLLNFDITICGERQSRVLRGEIILLR